MTRVDQPPRANRGNRRSRLRAARGRDLLRGLPRGRRPGLRPGRRGAPTSAAALLVALRLRAGRALRLGRRHEALQGLRAQAGRAAGRLRQTVPVQCAAEARVM